MGCASSKPTDHAAIKLEESTGDGAAKDAPHPPTLRTLGTSASFIQASGGSFGDRRNPNVAQKWDPHPCSPVPDGHYLLLKSEALRRVLPDYADARGGCCPKSLSQRPMKLEGARFNLQYPKEHVVILPAPTPQTVTTPACNRLCTLTLSCS